MPGECQPKCQSRCWAAINTNMPFAHRIPYSRRGSGVKLGRRGWVLSVGHALHQPMVNSGNPRAPFPLRLPVHPCGPGDGSLSRTAPHVAGWHWRWSAVGSSDMRCLHMDFPASSHGLPGSKQVKSVWLAKLWGWGKVPEVHCREILLKGSVSLLLAFFHSLLPQT